MQKNYYVWIRKKNQLQKESPFVVIMLYEALSNCEWKNVEFLDAFLELPKESISFVMLVCPSVRPLGTTRLPIVWFSLNFIFENFSKILWENWSFIKIGK